MVFQCGGSVLGLGKFLTESNVKHGRLQAAVAIRPSQPWCFSVAGRFWRLGKFLVGSESNVKHGRLQAAGAIRPSLPWCFNVARGSVVEAWAIILEFISCGFRKRR